MEPRLFLPKTVMSSKSPVRAHRTAPQETGREIDYAMVKANLPAFVLESM